MFRKAISGWANWMDGSRMRRRLSDVNQQGGNSRAGWSFSDNFRKQIKVGTMRGRFHIETNLPVSKLASMGQVLRAPVVFDVIQFCDFDNFMVIKLCGLNAQGTILARKNPSIPSRITR